MNNRIALGTVQFGLPYGIANASGQVDKATAKTILQLAREEGVDTLDTAVSYGVSEEYLGNVGVDGWKVITKLPEVPEERLIKVACWIKEQLRGSLDRLKVSKLSGLLLHRPSQLLGTNGKVIWESLQNLKKDGLVDKIGYSIYDPKELEPLWESFKPDIVQASYNIVDQRLKASGWLEKLHVNHVEVHVRSVFLQGLLLMNKEQRPEKFNRWNVLWKTWEQWLREQQLTPLEACLGFVISDVNIDRVVVGVDSLLQLKQIIDSLDKEISQIPPQLIITDQNLVNPSNWSNL